MLPSTETSSLSKSTRRYVRSTNAESIPNARGAPDEWHKAHRGGVRNTRNHFVTASSSESVTRGLAGRGRRRRSGYVSQKDVHAHTQSSGEQRPRSAALRQRGRSRWKGGRRYRRTASAVTREEETRTSRVRTNAEARNM